MAVEIPVVVDIDAAFAEAAKRVPQAIEPLQRQISKKQLNIKVDVGTKNAPNLRKFKDLLGESQSSATELERAISSVNKQISALSKAGGFNPAKGLKASERDLLALRAALETKLEAGNFIDNATEKIKGMASAANVAGKEATTALRSTNAGLKTQNGLIGMLVRNLTAYTAIFSGIKLIRNIREVTAEFEMQKVALGGIIQDATRANQLFAEIKAAAVQSPFEIKDLVSFTKQLSAYRIETDKLFDVTMRLADVSAGLGVDMSRLVLAYGQVRAASVLRGQELRQFTEAGIPLVDLLAKKFSQLRGEMVSTGEVFELISDRAVPFSMIEDIFNDMTNAGGIFYQMQIKQSETLKGQWMKLKDVISIAYDEMGRSSLVNSAMRGWIQLLSNVIKEWERLASVVNVAVYSFIAYKSAMNGLIPLYNHQQRAISRQIKLEKQQQIEQIRLASRTNALTKADQKRVAQIKKLTAEDIKRIYQMERMSQAQASMLFWRNKDNKEIVKAIQQTGVLTKAQMSAIKNMDWFQIRIKTWGSSIRTFFAKVGTAIASFWPIAALSAVITTVMGLVQAHESQVEAVRKVDKAYDEQEHTLITIENAYRKIQKAISDTADEQERATKEAESFGQKLGYAQRVVESLKKFGLGGDFDLTLLNTENIDDFVEKWLEQLNKANELTRDWGRSVAQVANAWEASVLGIHLAGDNLNTDIKQLTNAYIKMTSNKKYRQNVEEMREFIEYLAQNNKGYYDQISAALKMDAALAIQQKRRNESEYEYQMRLIRNYEVIRHIAQSDENIMKGRAKAFEPMFESINKFEVKLNEVEKEFDKTWGAMEGKDEITIKMAIDKIFAENQWDDWLKEAWIERVNQKYQMNIQINPVIGQIDVPKGMKGILATEFESLFTEQELSNMGSVTEIGKAIEEKMKKAAEAIAEADKMANNLVNNEMWSAKTREKIKSAQLAINAELEKEEKDRNKEAINEAIALIDALTKQNGVYEEQIMKKKESAKAEYDLAKAAKERLISEGLSDMGKDIKQAFPGLMKDAFREATDENYISRFLLSDEDLQKIKDGEDAYDLYAKHMKDIADAREKMADAGVTEQTVAEEQIRLDAQKLAITQELSNIDKIIADWNYEEAKAQYDNLRLAVQQATTAEARKKAEGELAAFVSRTNFEERAALVVEKQRLSAQLGIANAALGAQESLANFLKILDEAEKLWEGFGKRYNFTLKDKPKGSAQQDPWIMLFKNRMKFMQDFRNGVEDLDKYLSHSESLEREQEIMKGRGLSLGIKADELVGTPEELRDWYGKAIDEVVSKIRSMGGKEFEGLGVTEILAKDLTGRKIQKYQELLQELWKNATDFDTNELKKSLEEKIKRVTEEVKRSEAARGLFDSILGATGDKEIAATMTVSVYGDTGDEFYERVQKQLDAALSSVDSDKLSEELENAVAQQDFSYLVANIDKFGEKWRDVIQKMAEDSAKYSAGIAKNFAEAWAKIDDRAVKEQIIQQTTAEQIQKIMEAADDMMHAEGVTSDQLDKIRDMRDKLIGWLEGQKEIDLLKISDDYIAYFSEINVLTREQAAIVRGELRQAYFDAFNKGAIDAGTLSKNLRAIDTQFKKLSENASLLGAYLSNGVDGAIGKLQEYADTIDVIAAKMKRGDAISESEQSYVTNMLQMYGGKFGGESLKGISNFDQLLSSFTKNGQGIKGAGEAFGKMGNSISTFASKAGGAIAIVDMIVNAVNDTVNAVQELIDELNRMRSEENKIGGWYRYLSDFNKYAYKGWNDLKSGNGIGVLVDIINSLVSIVNNIKESKVKRLNEEIDRQADTIEDLDYQYARLENSIQKAFGSDYIANYNKQLDALTAKQAAYLAMAEAERAKKKSSDSEKIKEYENSAREAGDAIMDLQSKLSEFFAGTDLTSAAKDFANAWIEAYKEYGSVTTAMTEKFNDMIRSMVENSLAAKIMQELLQPIFDEIDKRALDGELSAADIATISDMATQRIPQINDAMVTLMNSLAAAGYNVRSKAGQFTGIARNIANASEESITGLAAGVNAQNFYMSYMPLIYNQVGEILALLGGGTPQTAAAGAALSANNELMMMYLSSLPDIRSDIFTIKNLLASVIKVNGTPAGSYVAVNG